MHHAETLPALLRMAASHADAPFLLTPQRDWSFGEFAQAVDAFAAGLSRLGIRRFDRVAIAAPNSPEWLITWFAVAKLGATLVTLNVAYREREFDYMLNQSGAVLLVCASCDGTFDFVGFLDRLRQRLERVQHYVFLGDAGFAGSHRWQDVSAAAADVASPALEAPVEPDDPAVILYTSGTTGDPKGAALTHASILASAVAQAAHLNQTAADVVIGHMPLNHVGGMTCTIVATMI
ncbi:MAG: AMP-binding protein, partial [Panacagrimonas sp.]